MNITTSASFSLMPLRFPALIPNTVSYNLVNIDKKINIYAQSHHTHDINVRYFNISSKADGIISVGYDQDRVAVTGKSN